MPPAATSPLPLKAAIPLAFPAGGMSVSGLRAEARRGRLTIMRIAGRDFVTLAAIEEMLRACTIHRAAERLPTAKHTMRHVARAVLMAYYTGSRPGDALRASFLDGPGRSFVDLEAGIYYRQPRGKRGTRKRQPPARLGRRILAHLKRWRKNSAGYVVEHEGRPVASVKTALARAVAAAGLPADVTLYTLRHSRATHLKQRGIDSWLVADALGSSEPMIERHYAHHAPEFQQEVADAR